MGKSAATALVHAMASTTNKRVPVKLNEAQAHWLNDPRPYFNQYTDRTGRALIDKGLIVITEHDYSGSGRCGYKMTETGQAALNRANGHQGGEA